MEVVSNIALISINETLFVQIISFLIFLFVANRFIFQPLLSTMGERDKQVEDAQDSISSVKEEMDEMASELARCEAEAKSKALGLKKELEAEGKAEAREIVDKARGEIEAMREKAAANVDAQISEARTYLKSESEALSLSIMEKILGRAI